MTHLGGKLYARKAEAQKSPNTRALPKRLDTRTLSDEQQACSLRTAGSERAMAARIVSRVRYLKRPKLHLADAAVQDVRGMIYTSELLAWTLRKK